MSFSEVILPSLKAASKVFIMAGTGVVLAKKDIMNPKTIKGVGEIVVNALMPALLFSKVASNISLDEWSTLWPLVCFSGLMILIGMFVGFLLFYLCRAPAHMRGFFMATVGFGNSTSVPLALFTSVVINSSVLLAGESDTPEQASTRGVSYILIYTILVTILRWTVADSLLTPPDGWSDAGYAALASGEDSANTVALQMRDIGSGAPASASTLGSGSRASADRPGKPRAHGKKKHSPDEHSSSPAFEDISREGASVMAAGEEDDGPPSGVVHSSDASDSEGDGDESTLQDGRLSFDTVPLTQQSTHPTTSAPRSLTFWQRLKKSFNPPIYASFVSIAVGFVSPVKNLFFFTKSDPASQPYLYFLTDTLNTMGDAVIPLVTLMLGAELSGGPMKLSRSESKTLTYVSTGGIIFAKLIVMPAIGTLISLLAFKLSIIPSDPVFRFVMMLESCCPSAINLIVMCTMHRFLDKELSTLLFYMYVLAVLTMPASIMVFLALI